MKRGGIRLFCRFALSGDSEALRCDQNWRLTQRMTDPISGARS